MTEDEAKKIKCAVRRLIRAELDAESQGGGDPDYWQDIQTELKSARASFFALLSSKTVQGLVRPKIQIIEADRPD